MLLLISAAMLRNLADKLYEKHKNAALDIEGIVKQLATAGDHDKITAVINLEVILLNVYACSQIKTREIVALKKIRMDNERERVSFVCLRFIFKHLIVHFSLSKSEVTVAVCCHFYFYNLFFSIILMFLLTRTYTAIVFTSMCHKLILPSVSHKTMMPNLTNPQPFPRATFSS
ncbi:hypothetical protein GYH30_027348 [Glycine max]|uniref:Uncharacterized protein n=1 Tax=Glycine max TaxID=3847 RepID=K7LI26_SOYBN|nr:hypothetical protein GYH30_027348 [Glycine max]